LSRVKVFPEHDHYLVMNDDITAEKRIQEALRDANEMFETASNTMQSGLLISDWDGDLLFSNRAMQEMLGYSEEELSWLKTSDLLPLERRETGQEMQLARLRGESVERRYRTAILKKSGQPIPVDVSASVFRQHGEVTGILSEFRDVSAEVQAEEEARHRARELEESTRLLTRAESVAATGSWQLDLRTGALVVSEGVYRVYGVDRASAHLRGWRYLDSVHPDDRERMREVAQGLRERSPYEAEYRVIRPDGALRRVHTRSGYEFDHAGERAFLVGIVQDVTELAEARHGLEASEQKFRSAAQTLRSGLVIAGWDAEILFANPAMHEMFGYTANEFASLRTTDLVPPEERKAWTDRRNARLRGEPVEDRCRSVLLQKGGEPIHVEIASSVFREGDEVIGVLSEIRDVTAEVDAERAARQRAHELRLLNDELLARSAERQALVQQLLRAQEEERRTVAYEIHDGPAQDLAAAQMFLQAHAARGPHGEDSRADLHLDHAGEYLGRALTETRRIMSRLRPVLLDDLGLVEALGTLLEEETGRAGVVLDFSAELGDARLDPAVEIVLYRVAQEAVANAVKHAGTDRVRVRVGCSPGGATLSVRDWGRGFDAGDLRRPTGGRHFGLVGMREQTELVGGKFELDSSVGDGTTVSVSIPLGAERSP
jgi:PAS domain S-box-containing protein